MGGTSTSGGGRRRRWTQRSCRTGEGGVVRRTVAVPAPAHEERGAITKGLTHVDKQQRVCGLLSDSRSSSGCTTKEFLYSDLCEFKHKRSSSNISKLPIASQRSSSSSPIENEVPRKKVLLHASSNVSDYWLPYRLKFHRGKEINSAKQAPTLKKSSGMNSFSYQLARSAGKSDSMKIGPLDAKCSLSEKMSLLGRTQHGRSHLNQNFMVASNQRHKIAQHVEATNILRKDIVQKQSDASTGRHWQTLLDNALVRRSLQLPNPNEESSELWSCTNSESDKAVCFSSSDSIDGLQVSFSSDTSETSDNSKLSSDQWRMTFNKVHCPLAARINSVSLTTCKEIEHPSPVSVLEPLAEDFSDAENVKQDTADPHDPQLRPELVNFPSVKTVAEVGPMGGFDDYLCCEMEAGENAETIQLVEEIHEEFEDEEERDFSYLLDILISSGIHGTEEDQMYKVCQSLDCPTGYDVFDKLESKYMKVAQWSRSDRKLTFDMVNSILSEILAPCLDMHPWVTTARNMAPVWGSEGLLEKVLQILVRRQEELALCVREPKAEKKVFDHKWPDLADYIDRAGRDVEKMIKDDLLEELVLDLLSS